ncbi:hypothetical protein ACMX25_40005 [Caballeronia sp. 15715]|uniref:hypothetical protein n=1 Tax=Caballeronia sp. 15715 TaxID=3391030 RepID=UPI0039E71B41
MLLIENARGTAGRIVLGGRTIRRGKMVLPIKVVKVIDSSEEEFICVCDGLSFVRFEIKQIVHFRLALLIAAVMLAVIAGIEIAIFI